VALEDKAVESYVATLGEARKNHLSNEWTKKTLESLNRFRPQEYPVLKDPKGAFTTEILYPTEMVDLTAPRQTAPTVEREGPG